MNGVMDALTSSLSKIAVYAVIVIIIAAILGIGYKILERKLLSWADQKRQERENKRNAPRD